jgi:TolA-binding protein
MNARPQPIRLALALALASAAPASAQKLFTNENKELAWDSVTMQGSNVAYRFKEGDKERTLNIPSTNIIRVDFPEPTDLQDAEAAINRGDPDTALEKIESVIKQFTPFKTTAGSYWAIASLTKLEALGLKKSSDEFDKLRAEIKTINLSPSDQVRMGGADALGDYAKGLYGPAKTAIVKLIPRTDDASVLAKLYNLLGDIHSKLGAYPDALEAYLSVSVFYGSQADQLPISELGAARSLKKMDRLEDARDMLNGIKERYPTSPQGQAARKELEDLLKVLGAATQAKSEAEEKAAAAEKATPAAPTK